MTPSDATAIEEVGRYMDQGGNDGRGVELTQKSCGGRRVVAFSHGDFGRYLASFTGRPEPALGRSARGPARPCGRETIGAPGS